MIIGLTGKNGSGKGEVAQFLKKAGYLYFSLSDVLRTELENEGIKVTRESLTKKGNELRKELGVGALAEKVKNLLPKIGNIVIDSIRNPGEVASLRQLENFFFVEVRADSKVRFERLKNRGRENDPTNYDDFLKCEKRENDGKNLDKQQLDMTGKLADVYVVNDTTLDDLYPQVIKVINDFAKEIKRPSWDEYFMEIARVVSLRGNCLKRKVGAVIVKDRRVISSGYNGTPRGVKNCYEGGCKRCNSLAPSGEDLGSCVCSHAEENSIVQAAYHGVSTKGTYMYITYSPCITCAKMIINAGVEEVVYDKAYTIEAEPLSLLKKAGVRVRPIDK